MKEGFLENVASNYALIILGLWVIGSIIMIIGGYLMYKSEQEIKNYQSVNAYIKNAICSEHSDISGSGRSRVSVTKYRCNVTLTYVVNDKKLETTINTDSNYSYKTGQNLNIYYNPEDPKQIIMDKSTTLYGQVLIGLGLLLTIISIYLFTKCWKNGCKTLGALFFISNVFDY